MTPTRSFAPFFLCVGWKKVREAEIKKSAAGALRRPTGIFTESHD